MSDAYGASEPRLIPGSSSNQGAVLFEEDNHGDRCFVIMNGEVRISKFIPNIGEEALGVASQETISA